MKARSVRQTPWWFILGLCFSAILGIALGTGTTGASPVNTGLAAMATQKVPFFTPSPTRTPSPTITPVCGPAWRYISCPNPYYANQFTGVDFVSERDVWAVGYMGNNGEGISLIVHWDGTQWSIVPSPNVPGRSTFLYSISVVSADDIWAVGYSGHWSIGFQTLIMHWDGNQWSIVDSPNVGSSMLESVSAIASDDVWAVGRAYTTTNGQNLTMHWDGNQWSVVPAPNASTIEDDLRGVSALSSNDVWAVGEYWDDAQLTRLTLTLHWDGTQWRIVPSPNPANIAMLNGVESIAPNDVWAVGYSFDTSTYVNRALTLHWNGSAWNVVPNPSNYTLSAVSATASDDVWAVGTYSGVMGALIMHWNGSTWILHSNINGDAFAGVAAVWRNDVWAVGTSWPQTAIARYNDPCAAATQTPTPTMTVTGTPPTATSTRTATRTPTITPTPTITNTPSSTNTGIPSFTPTFTSTRGPSNTPTTTKSATPTRTGTLTSTPSWTPTGINTATGTPAVSWTPTPTACAAEFSDVPPGSTFYPFVRCLACRGIISGYDSGCDTGNPCFRPNNNVIRGQLAKIVSNAAGFSDPQETQLFEDVLPSSVFFPYTGRLASRGYMTGYACGGPGEPCIEPNRRPYFRQYYNATRGQIAKIDAEGAGYNETISPTQQTFADVPPTSTFWVYIERIALHGVIAGYPGDGVTVNPCTGQVEQTGLLYFRWCNNATRGQTAKIVANTFFPGCDTP